MSWRSILLLLGSTIAVCVVTSTFVTMRISDILRGQFQRENDLLIREIELLYMDITEIRGVLMRIDEEVDDLENGETDGPPPDRAPLELELPSKDEGPV